MGCLCVNDFQDLLGGTLDSARRSSVELHLENCLTCRTAYLNFSNAQATGTPPRHDPTDVTLVSQPPRPSTTDETIASDQGGISSHSETRHFPRIDGYTITGVLGHGGMGVVYRAVQAKLNRAVALKVLPAIVGNANPAAVRRFRREATAAARLHHTNIIPIYDFGESVDAYYYAMELISGRPLDTLVSELGERSGVSPSAAELGSLLQSLKQDTLTPEDTAGNSSSSDSSRPDASPIPPAGRKYFEQIARWMRDTAEALHYAHDQGVIHRDVKPANLILSTDGRIMVADFGLAKTADEASMTATGAMLGTLRYASPEQAMAGRIPLDHRTDIYSLGATMYELLTFRPAFPGTEQQEILSAIISRDPSPPRKLNNHIPPELETICLKCLEKSPDARYDTGRALADDLRRFASDIPIVARKPSVARRIAKFVKRHKAPVIASTTTVLLVTSLLLWQRETAARKRAQIASLQDSAMALALTNNWDRAAGELRTALRIDRDHIQTLLTLAWLKLEHFRALPKQATLESQQEVVRVCRQILRANPQSIKSLGFLGIALRRLGRYPEAIETLKGALELEPDAYHSWSNLGALYAVTGDLSQAELCLNKGAKLAGRAKDRWHAAVWRNLAALESFQGRRQAVEHLETAIDCDSTGALTWVLRARLALSSDDDSVIGEALDDAKHADRIAVFGNARAKRVRAMAHLKSGEFEQAATQAQLAIDLGDLAGINRLIMANAFAESGRRGDAQTQLNEAREAWPEELRESGGFIAKAGAGDLWIESANEWLALAEKASNAVRTKVP